MARAKNKQRMCANLLAGFRVIVRASVGVKVKVRVTVWIRVLGLTLRVTVRILDRTTAATQ